MTSNGQSPGETVGCDTESKPFVNKFINDGSFLETFKKMQQEQQKLQQLSVQSIKQEPVDQQESATHKHDNIAIKEEKDFKSDPVKKEEPDEKTINSPKNNSLKSPSSAKIMLGKRRNQKLKVGIIKRDRKETESEDDLDAWTKYMREVRQYKEKYGDDSDKKRPLVK